MEHYTKIKMNEQLLHVQCTWISQTSSLAAFKNFKFSLVFRNSIMMSLDHSAFWIFMFMCFDVFGKFSAIISLSTFSTSSSFLSMFFLSIFSLSFRLGRFYFVLFQFSDFFSLCPMHSAAGCTTELFISIIVFFSSKISICYLHSPFFCWDVLFLCWGFLF